MDDALDGYPFTISHAMVSSCWLLLSGFTVATIASRIRSPTLPASTAACRIASACSADRFCIAKPAHFRPSSMA
jgi:hypothetical protein